MVAVKVFFPLGRDLSTLRRRSTVLSFHIFSRAPAREGLCLFHPMNIPNFAKIGGFEC